MAKYRITTEGGTYEVTTDEPSQGSAQAATGAVQPSTAPEVHPPSTQPNAAPTPTSSWDTLRKLLNPTGAKLGDPTGWDTPKGQEAQKWLNRAAMVAGPLELGANPAVRGALTGAAKAIPDATRGLLETPNLMRPGTAVTSAYDFLKSLVQGGKAGMGPASQDMSPKAQQMLQVLKQSQNPTVTAKPMENPVVGQASIPRKDLFGTPLAPPPSVAPGPTPLTGATTPGPVGGPTGLQIGAAHPMISSALPSPMGGAMGAQTGIPRPVIPQPLPGPAGGPMGMQTGAAPPMIPQAPPPPMPAASTVNPKVEELFRRLLTRHATK